MKYKGDLPWSAYIDFETIALTDSCLDPGDKNMFAVSYAIIFAFHPNLNFERVIIDYSFDRSLDKDTTLGFLSRDKMQLLNRNTLLQLRDTAYNASTRKDKLAISTLFNIELKFATDALLKWFNAKINSKNLEVDLTEKNKFQNENPIDWEKGKWCICNLPTDVNPRSLEYEETDISYFDFLITKEHAFLRNIFSHEELNKSPSISRYFTKNFKNQSFHGKSCK